MGESELSEEGVEFQSDTGAAVGMSLRLVRERVVLYKGEVVGRGGGREEVAE